MKLSKIFFGVAAAAMFAACSSDDVAQNNWEGVFDVDGNAYLKVAITTPNALPATRASYDDKGSDYGNYNDGDAKEYAVKNATLYIFGQKSATDTEDKFVCIKGYDISGLSWSADGNKWITQNGTDVVAIDKNTAVGYNKLWALVVLNNDGWAQPTPDETFATYAAKTSAGHTGKLADFTATGFYMSNMPYADAAAPGIAKVNTLYPIDMAKIYSKKQDAVDDVTSATTVNVERGVAKIQVVEEVSTKELSNGTAYTFGDWFVDNYNPKAYVVRHCAAPTTQYSGATEFGYLNFKRTITGTVSNTYRFAHPTEVTTDAYRTDWAIDPNYNMDVDGELTTVKGLGAVPTTVKTLPTISRTNLANAESYYFHENTFPVNHQTERNTTRVIVPAIFNNGDPFVTLGSEPDVVYDEAVLKTKVLDFLGSHCTDLANWKSTHMTSGTLDDAFTINYTAAAGPLAITIDFNTSVDEAHFGGSTTNKDAAQTAFSGIKSTVDAFLAANETFTYYADGVAYYPILIQHFGDYDTKWTADANTMTANTPGLIYGYTTDHEATAEKNYLGRYGVVRNNWYRISVSGVSKIGDATISDIVKDRTDDKVEAAYIKYTVNIVPWVLRGIQDAKL